MKFNRATLLGGSTSCARAMLGRTTNNVITRTETAVRELEIERNIVKCLSSRVSVLGEPNSARVISVLVCELRNPWITALAGNGCGKSSTSWTSGAFSSTAGAYL